MLETEHFSKSLAQDVSDYYLPKFTRKTDQKLHHLGYRKSYLVIIGPKSHEKLTKIEIR